MKVAIAVHHFPPRYSGGAEWRAHRTAASLQARGHEVFCICVDRIDAGPDNGVAWRDDIYEGVRVRRLSFNRNASPDPFQWEYDNPWIGDHLTAYLSEIRPDVFHLISGYLISARGLLAARALGIPTVVSLTDYWFLCRRITMLRSNGQISTLPITAMTCARCLGEEQRRYRLLGRLFPGLMDVFWHLHKPAIRRIEARMSFLHETLNQADAVISPSQFLRTMYIEAGVDPQRIVFIRQGRDFPQLSPEVLEKMPASGLRVGYLGQIARHKGVHVLLEAARRLPGVPLTVHVYGDAAPFPDYARDLRRRIASDSRLQLAGMYDPKEVSRIFREIDVLVVPSLWYENSPNSILEAFAHRTPVVASNLGGMAELVRHGENGLFFEAGNADDLARQLRCLQSEPGLLSQLRTGIGPVKNVTEEMVELEGIYDRVRATRRYA